MSWICLFRVASATPRAASLILCAAVLSACDAPRTVPAAGSAPVSTKIPASASTHGLASVGEALSWVTLPGGRFTMGRDGGDDDEAPAHEVVVPSFQMTRSEVTTAQFRRCVAAGSCEAPGTGDRCTEGRPDSETLPVTCVTWSQARAFCAFVGGRLPSEAEWEYAARGTNPWDPSGPEVPDCRRARARGPVAGRRYPWGNEAPSCQRVHMPDARGPGCGTGAPAPVCSRPGGHSPEGLCDLSGNVWEWVEDCWHKGYAGAPTDGSAFTTGCKESWRKVVRGSSFLNGTKDNLRAASRDSSPEAQRYFSIGFRCARALPDGAGGPETRKP